MIFELAAHHRLPTNSLCNKGRRIQREAWGTTRASKNSASPTAAFTFTTTSSRAILI
jgi:hypothetical protein